MSRKIDLVISEQIDRFKGAMELYLIERDVNVRRNMAQEFGEDLLQRVDYWPVPKQWLRGEFGTKERVAFRSLLQAYQRRLKRDKRIAAKQNSLRRCG